MLRHLFAANHYCFSYYVSKVKETVYCHLCGLSAAYGDGGVIIAEWSDCMDA